MSDDARTGRPDAHDDRSQIPQFLAAISPQQLAARLPNLEVTELLGQGGMGVVYKGRQVFLDRPVAIKVIRPDFNSPERQRNFIHEARSLAKLAHPYIVNVFDCGKADDLFYFVMEYVEGQSLRHFIASKSVTARDVLDFLPQVGEALQFAHDAGVVHRDVKPENILVDPRNRVRLVDFGLAKWLAPGGSGRNARQSRRRHLGLHRARATLDARTRRPSCRHLFHRRRLLRNAHRSGPACRVPAAVKVVSGRSAVRPIVARALERDRERRYQQMREMNSDVQLLTRTPESTLRITKSIPAPVERVFEAWTRPEVMADWYAPTDEFLPSTIEVDLRVGGTYKVGMKHKDRDLHLVTGQYCRIEEPHLLSFTWAWQTHDVETPDLHLKPETQVTIELCPNGGSTDLTLTHERFRDEALRDRHKEGWTGCLSRLAAKVGR